MIIANTVSSFNIHDVYYCKPIRNKIMHGGTFIRLIYSDDVVSINGVHVSFSLCGRIQEVYNNKFKYTPAGHDDESLILAINIIERKLLENVNIQHKSPQYKLREQLCTGCFKYFQDNVNTNTKQTRSNHTNSVCLANFILKISGIWTTESEYGITYKFTKVS
jgi:hypothetical protein